MNLLTEPLVEVEPEAPSVSVREGLRLSQVPMIGLRLLIGVFLCTGLPAAVLVVGWTFRLMRRRIVRGWWRQSDARAGLRFEEFVRTVPVDVSSAPLPRWFVASDFRSRLQRPNRKGQAPGRLRMALRIPRLLLGGLLENVCYGLLVLFVSALFVWPGGLFLLGGWEYGWNVSFNKGYEQAYIGRTVGFVGVVMLASAMCYVPMATTHLAISGNIRSFFQFRLIFRLIRHKRVSLAGYALLVVALGFPASFLWGMVVFLPNMFPWLETATPRQMNTFIQRFSLLGAFYVFPAYVVVHLAAARIYRGAVLNLIRREPEWGDRMPASTRRILESLDLWESEPARRPNRLIRAVVSTSRRGSHAMLWVVTVLAWFLVPAEMLLAQFLVYHPYLVWLNP
ncbi:MAG TPA: hypothetical protein VFT74_18345, partial [Isosphaeraceae bacterium]|nr:hypothetical protein [Isosphaeraceae bacterium]